MTPKRGVLLDIDGVLQVSMRSVEGAVETLRWLEAHGYQTSITDFGRQNSSDDLLQGEAPVECKRQETCLYKFVL